MIIFAIPLRAKSTAKNWTEVESKFNATLKSIFNQKGSSSFKVVVACNDIPKLERVYDERLEFIELDIPTPKSWIEMSRDKFWKLTVIAVRIREILEKQENPENGIYVMPVDADDYLNCQIAEYCEQNPNEYGFISKSGYVWQEGKKYIKKYKELHTYCGSCNVIKMYRGFAIRNAL